MTLTSDRRKQEEEARRQKEIAEALAAEEEARAEARRRLGMSPSGVFVPVGDLGLDDEVRRRQAGRLASGARPQSNSSAWS